MNKQVLHVLVMDFGKFNSLKVYFRSFLSVRVIL